MDDHTPHPLDGLRRYVIGALTLAALLPALAGLVGLHYAPGGIL